MKEKFKPVMMQTAFSFASLSYAQRKKVGAIVCDKNGRILLTGYNGTITGTDNCCEVSTDVECTNCDAGHIIENNTLTTCPNCDHNGMVLETSKEVLHAEENIICHAARKGIALEDTYMFVTLSPCLPCARKIVQCGVKEVYYYEEYRDIEGVKYLKQHIKCEQLI